MTKSYEEVVDYVTVSTPLTKEKTKFGYACEKVNNRVASASKTATKKYQEKLTDIDIDFASVDEKENLIIVEGKYQYTKENARKRLEAIRLAETSLYATKIEFEPYYATEMPELNEYQIEKLKGFVISENPKDKTEYTEIKNEAPKESTIDDTNTSVG